MVPQLTRLVVPLVLCALLVPPADAQDEGGFEISPTDFLPLEVGNQWTYVHWYENAFYNRFEIVDGVIREDTFGPDAEYDSPLDPEWMSMRAIAELPGYPLTARYERESPFFDSLWIDGELTIEITHTETIEGHEYFVFSDPAYDLPPPPLFFFSGQKVRFSDEGVLLFRRQERDIPVYDFSQVHIDKHYTTPEYPVRDDVNDPIPVAFEMSRELRDARHADGWSLGPHPPANFGPAFATIFYSRLRLFRYSIHSVYFVTGYGLALYNIYFPGLHWSLDFTNSLYPVSAVIGGQKIEYPEVRREWWITNVQPTSWGQLKARYGPHP